jgi:hypothetical protein
MLCLLGLMPCGRAGDRDWSTKAVFEIEDKDKQREYLFGCSYDSGSKKLYAVRARSDIFNTGLVVVDCAGKNPKTVTRKGTDSSTGVPLPLGFGPTPIALPGGAWVAVVGPGALQIMHVSESGLQQKGSVKVKGKGHASQFDPKAKPQRYRFLLYDPATQMLITDEEKDLRIWRAKVSDEKKQGKLDKQDSLTDAHEADIVCGCVSPKGQVFATADSDGTVKLWEWRKTAYQASKTKFNGSHDGCACLAFAPDGKTLVSGSKYTVKLWAVSTGKATANFKVSGKGIACVAFSPDGKTLATGGQEGIKLWDVATSKLQTALQRNRESAYFVAFIDNGRFVTASYANNSSVIRLWWAEVSGK